MMCANCPPTSITADQLNSTTAQRCVLFCVFWEEGKVGSQLPVLERWFRRRLTSGYTVLKLVWLVTSPVMMQSNLPLIRSHGSAQVLCCKPHSAFIEMCPALLLIMIMKAVPETEGGRKNWGSLVYSPVKKVFGETWAQAAVHQSEAPSFELGMQQNTYIIH